MPQPTPSLEQQVQVKEKLDTTTKIVLGTGIFCAVVFLINFVLLFNAGIVGLNQVFIQKKNFQVALSTAGQEVVINKNKYTTDQGDVIFELYSVSPSYPYLPTNNIKNNETANFDDDETSLSFPLNNDVLRAGDVIQITGTIATESQQGAAFQNYKIEYGIGESPTRWFNNHLTLVNGGLTPIQNGIIGYWDTSFITSANFYTIRIIVNFLNEEQELSYIRSLALDPTLKQGWPQMTNQYFFAPPSLGKFGSENYLRIGATPLSSLALYLFNNNGNVITGWPQFTSSQSFTSNTFADVNNDGLTDVILPVTPNAANPLALYAWNGNGTAISGFPKAIETGLIQYPAIIKDIDNDGRDELIAASQSDTDYTNNTSKGRGSIYVWELDSRHNATANQWPEFQHDPQHTGYLPPIN